jgi:hypothetical protein
MTIPITISTDRRKIISQAVHETITHFGNELLPEEALCFYYAGLTAALCNHVLQTFLAQAGHPDSTLYHYCMECGNISIRTTSDPNDHSQAVNFGGYGNTAKQGKFHCWVVGVYKRYGQTFQIIGPSEFIDLTSRFYPINAQKQGWTWRRDDIHDYVWLQEDQLEEFGISPYCEEKVSIEFNNYWCDFDKDYKFLDYSIRRYVKLKNPTYKE